ncbi:MAG: hypothetical protein SF097_00565 [Acidobacteriota bacterium]|nr:hypothetical protein [Acidobacteriota bacterium]
MKSRLFYLMVVFTALCLDTPAQSERKPIKIKRRSDKVVVVCYQPPPDVMTTKNITDVEAKLPEVIGLLKKGGGLELKVDRQKAFERIRQELSDVNVFEIMDFRLCVQHGNDVLTAEEYKEGSKEFRPKKTNSKLLTEKVAEYTALLTKIQGFPDEVEDDDKKEAQRTWVKCVELCNEIFALIKANFPSRMQDIFVIKGQSDGPTEDAISEQMKRVRKRMQERISHFDKSKFKEAKREVDGWGEIAKEIMDKFQ